MFDLEVAQTPSPSADSPAGLVPLGRGAKGLKGVVARVGGVAGAGGDGVSAEELERRLLEIGFVEGAEVEILHEGAFGRDPIAVRLDDSRVALRRREADAVLVRPV
ncbi:MAG: FeoA family protein [Caulobacteraceae bacterium]